MVRCATCCAACSPPAFEDVVAVIALYRPGPMGRTPTTTTPTARTTGRAVRPIHPELAEPLEDILAETYGLIVYQEQIMRIAQKVAGYSLARADILRKAMGKKKREVLDKEYEGFCGRHEAPTVVAAGDQGMWDTVHALRGLRIQQVTRRGLRDGVLLDGVPQGELPGRIHGGAVDVGRRRQAQRRRIPGRLPQARHHRAATRRQRVRMNFASVGDDIRYGLGAVRNVGANVVALDHPNRARDKGQIHRLLRLPQQDRHRACNKKVTESLIKAGAFDSLDHPRKGLFLVHTDAVESVLGTKKAEAMGQFDLFGGADTATDAVFSIKVPDEEWDDKHKLALEREMLAGLYVSGHPLNGVAHLLLGQVDTQIPSILNGEIPNEAQVRVGGNSRPGVNRRVNKSGMDLGVSPIGGPDRQHQGDVLSAHLLQRRCGDHRRRGGAGQRQGQNPRTTGSALSLTTLWCPTFRMPRSTGRWR